MKLSKRLIGMMVFVLVLTLSVAAPVSAANTQDNDIINFTFPSSTHYVVSKDVKENTTPLYVLIQNINNGETGIYCKAYGYDAESDFKGNFTMYNGKYVTEVLIFEGVKYSVRSGIYERLHGQGTCYAAPAFRCSYVFPNETIYHGKWSPDSTRVYTVAQEAPN